MSQHPETVEIQIEKTAQNPTGVVVINKEDYNPEIHTLAGVELDNEENDDATGTQPPSQPWLNN